MTTIVIKYKGILLFMLVYWCICIAMLTKEHNLLYPMLGWNILLALLPLFFIKAAEIKQGQGKKVWSVLWAVLWLFFFPNSVYMATDFIHISRNTFLEYSQSGSIVYSSDIMAWAKLLVIAIGFLFAMLVGLESFYIFEEIIRKRFSKFMCYMLILGTALLSGIGVYIGRFLRFNSWDVLFRPIELLRQVLDAADGFAVQFIVIFTIFILGSYCLFKMFRSSLSLKK